MEPALLAASVGLAAVFAAAGLSKLGDPGGFRRTLADFGVPSRLTRPLALLLPLLEVATAAALVPARTHVFGAAAALALLLVFTVAMALSLMRGRTPECHCFGRLHSARVSWWTVARNGLLAMVSAGVAFGSTPVVLLLAAGVAALGLTAFERRRGDAPAPQGLSVGTEAPEFRLQALDGHEVTLAVLRERGTPVLLVFSDAHCGPCSALAPRVAGWQRELAGSLTIAVIERGRERTDARDEHSRSDVLRADDDEVASAYGAQGTPAAVVVAKDGSIASPVAVANYRIERLVADVLGAPPLPVAEPRREHSLTRLELLARAGTTAAAIALLGVRDAAAGRIILKCKYVRCGNKCCPKTAVCRTRRGKKVCVCPDGRDACGAKCCKETFECRKTARGKRVCVCPPRTRLCHGRCVPLTDPSHCGGCGRECPPATVCVSGQCVGGDGSGTAPGGLPPCDCPPGRTCCDGACVDLNTNALHCGRCDQACPAGQTCCGGSCKDLQADAQNCGQCGKRCPPGQACAGGACGASAGGGGCPPGLTSCDGRCVDLNADNENCGECGRKCAEGLTCCGAADCVDTRIRPDHCTACFRECDPFLCNCWDSQCQGAPEHGCWGTTPPARRQRLFLQRRR